MKLEGELAFLPTNISLEPESQSFVFDDNNQTSAGYTLPNQKVKEYENELSTFFKNNERGLDPTHFGMEAEDRTPKLDFSNSVIDSKNGYEAQVRDLVEPVSHSSNDIESFMKFPNDIESVKRSATSPISNPLVERDPLENSVDVYMDKTVTECESDVEMCYKESEYHTVKDICVDEEVLTKDKIMFVNSVDEKDPNFFGSEGYENNEKLKDDSCINILKLRENNEKLKDDSCTNILKLPPTGELDQVSGSCDEPKDLKHNGEDATGKLSGNVHDETVLPEDKVLLQDLFAQDSTSSDHKGAQMPGEPELQSKFEEAEKMVAETVFSSPAADGESNGDSMLLESVNLNHQVDPSAHADCTKKECPEVGDCKCDGTQHTPKPVEGKSNDRAVTSQVRHSLGESSFSAVGPVSGRISYSGPVPYSGSISLRSDSSTTSTRSFAFPVLQSEWNTSPVRMAKADRRRYRKQRCWREGLLCCKF